MSESIEFFLDQNLTNFYHEQIPYTKFIGLKVGFGTQKERLMFHLPYQDMLIGNYLLPALHGGLIGGLMESAAAISLHYHTQLHQIPKMIDFSLDYLRPGKPKDCYASCVLVRKGTRITNLSVRVWQQDEHYPISTGRAHFLMPPLKNEIS